jgi:hypothetical protein
MFSSRNPAWFLRWSQFRKDYRRLWEDVKWYSWVMMESELIGLFERRMWDVGRCSQYLSNIEGLLSHISFPMKFQISWDMADILSARVGIIVTTNESPTNLMEIARKTKRIKWQHYLNVNLITFQRDTSIDNLHKNVRYCDGIELDHGIVCKI